MDDPDIDIDAEEDENITHMAVVTQEPPPGVPRIKISAQSMNQRIFTILLSSIAGVDAQPDTLDKGPYGPWFYLIEQYAAEQLTMVAINNALSTTTTVKTKSQLKKSQCK
eukprot:scaffold14925_cov97-Isochrysis_galbana.AAC.2